MKYYVGQEASVSKTISDYDVYSFAGITGDFNPVHVNKYEAEKSIFKDRIAHGLLVSGFISTVLGMYLPGPGTIYLQQNLSFRKPVYIGDTITAKVIIQEIDEVKNIAQLNTTVINQHGKVVIEGVALVKLP
ncbi:MaoC family dehydratase [Clostridium sp. ZBS4]|uniref:MaoC family dehydratase n=1 Tax=Clostridium sp. ZBS4 TaxID=2949974 RepID=UPI00207AD0E3|nr:MaoC family dehydratase [Clostridium sp. ZBS4]